MSKKHEPVDPEFLIDPALAVASPLIKQTLDYWDSKRGDRMAPARSEWDLREAKAIMPHLQFFEVIDGGRAFRTRLAGTAVVRALKEDTTGQVFDDTSTRPVVHRVLRAVRWVVEHRKPLRTFTARTALEGQDFLSHETLFLPLSSDGATVDIIAVVSMFKAASAS